jgi:hypothetical protein
MSACIFHLLLNGRIVSSFVQGLCIIVSERSPRLAFQAVFVIDAFSNSNDTLEDFTEVLGCGLMWGGCGSLFRRPCDHNIAFKSTASPLLRARYTDLIFYCC